MNDAVLDGKNGRSLTLRRASEKDADGIWSFHVELAIPEGRVEIAVWDLGDEIAEFLRDISDLGQGFDGVRRYSNLEGQLQLTCRHDGESAVACSVTLRHPAPPEWSFEAVLEFDAGEHLEQIAAAVESFVPST